MGCSGLLVIMDNTCSRSPTRDLHPIWHHNVVPVTVTVYVQIRLWYGRSVVQKACQIQSTTVSLFPCPQFHRRQMRQAVDPPSYPFYKATTSSTSLMSRRASLSFRCCIVLLPTSLQADHQLKYMMSNALQAVPPPTGRLRCFMWTSCPAAQFVIVTSLGLQCFTLRKQALHCSKQSKALQEAAIQTCRASFGPSTSTIHVFSS